jgi:hypothetical protein
VSKYEESGYAWGLALGSMLGPIVAIPILLVGACAVVVMAQLVKVVCLLVFFFVKSVAAIGQAVTSWFSSGWFVPAALVAAQLLVGFLMGFGAGLRVEKPRVRR